MPARLSHMLQLPALADQRYERTIGSLASAGAGFNPEHVLYCTVLYCIVLYCIVLYCIVLYCIVLYCIVLAVDGQC
jgi:hypothetical protein